MTAIHTLSFLAVQFFASFRFSPLADIILSLALGIWNTFASSVYLAFVVTSGDISGCADDFTGDEFVDCMKKFQFNEAFLGAASVLGIAAGYVALLS